MSGAQPDPGRSFGVGGEALGAGDLARRLLQLDPNTVISWAEGDETHESVVINGIADVLDSGEIVNSRILNVLRYDEFYDETEIARALYEEGNTL